jgi:predicted ATP-dependent Lon-type protease
MYDPRESNRKLLKNLLAKIESEPFEFFDVVFSDIENETFIEQFNNPIKTIMPCTTTKNQN